LYEQEYPNLAIRKKRNTKKIYCGLNTPPLIQNAPNYVYVLEQIIRKIVSNQLSDTLIDLKHNTFKVFTGKRIFPLNTIKSLSAGHF